MEQVLYKKEIEEISDSGYLRKDSTITDALIDNFYNSILKKDEKKILELAFSENMHQEDLDDLLKIWDIEVKGGAKSLMLAYIMKMHPEMKFTSYEEPRLKGLLNFYKFSNMGIISHYKKICRALNAEGITPMILKGGAMKFLRPELPRIMGDIDILVPDNVFMKSAKIACSLGYVFYDIYSHSIDIHKPDSDSGVLDIHRFIFMGTGHERKLLKNLFKRSREENVFGVKTLIPSNEDMMFISLVNLARNLREKTSQAGLIYTIFDCKFLQESKPDFDWEIVKENARLTKTEVQMNFAIKFLMRISKNIFPEALQSDVLFEKETIEYSNMVMFNRFYLEDLRTICHPLKMQDLFIKPAIWSDYFKYKPKYFGLKLLRKHPKLIEWFIKDLKTKDYNFEK